MRKYKLSINGQTFNVEIISEQIDSYEVSVNGELIIVNKDSSQILNPTGKEKKEERKKERIHTYYYIHAYRRYSQKQTNN